MIPTPEEFSSRPVPELLEAAAAGIFAFDHRLLHGILDRGTVAVGDILTFGRDSEREEDNVDIRPDIVAMCRHLQPEGALSLYIDFIRDQPDNIYDDLVEAIVGIGQPAVEPLIELYNDLEEQQSGEVAFVLAALGHHDDRIRAILLERLEYDAGEGALLLSMYRDESLIPRLEELVAETEDERLKNELQAAISDIREAPATTRDLDYDIWSQYPKLESPDFAGLSEKDLQALLASPSAEYRAQAAHSLQGDLSSATIRKLLECARSDEDTKVRQECWEALAGAVDTETVHKAMLERAQDENAPPEERVAVLIGLGDETAKAPLRDLVIRFYEQGGRMREKAMEAMRRTWDRSFAPYFPKHLDDPDPEIRREAIWGVGFLAIHDSAESLRRFFEDDDYRADALYAYALGVRGETSRGRAPAMFRKIEKLAGGLGEEEELIIKMAIDRRLELHGFEPYFQREGEEVAEPESPAPPTPISAGRNDTCPCGSGKKYKKCCGA